MKAFGEVDYTNVSLCFPTPTLIGSGNEGISQNRAIKHVAFARDTPSCAQIYQIERETRKDKRW